MLPQGFLGTRGDILMDLVVLSFIVILPVLVISWRAARAGKFSRHRAIQVTLVLLLAGGFFLFSQQNVCIILNLG